MAGNQVPKLDQLRQPVEPVYSLIGQFVHAGLFGKEHLIGIVIFVLACSYNNDRVENAAAY